MYETIQEDTDKKEIPLSCDGPTEPRGPAAYLF